MVKKEFIIEPERQTPIMHRTDVLVVGGGTAGIAASVAAARNGADVTIVERYGYLGGLATGGLITFILVLDDSDGNQVIRGLCQEVIDNLSRLGAATIPHVWRGESERQERMKERYEVVFDPEAFKFIADSMIAEANVKIYFHSLATDVICKGKNMRGIIVQTRSGRYAILAKVVIDASGDGDVFALAGVPFNKDKVMVNPWFRMGNVNTKKILSGDKVIRDGLVLILGCRYGESAQRTRRIIDGTSLEDLAYVEIESRKEAMECAKFYKDNIPGFESAYLIDTSTQPGIRKTRRMIGEYMLCINDKNRSFHDTVAISGNWMGGKDVYEIPYRCLVPQKADNLLVAGRCISTDEKANDVIRVIAVCMATGEAAGTAAALTVKNKVVPRDLDVKLLQEALTQNGAIVKRRR